MDISDKKVEMKLMGMGGYKMKQEDRKGEERGKHFHNKT